MQEDKNINKEKVNLKDNKIKKEKVVYYDDGHTISDMSCLNNSKKKTQQQYTTYNKPRATEREKLKTFFAAFKMMIGPTIVALTILAILYIIFSLLAN